MRESRFPQEHCITSLIFNLYPNIPQNNYVYSMQTSMELARVTPPATDVLIIPIEALELDYGVNVAV
jgi:hypothetical protein